MMHNTKDEMGRRILSVYRHFQRESRVGGSLSINNFAAVFASQDWGKMIDIADGLEYALKQGWLEKIKGQAFALTEKGFRELQFGRWYYIIS